MKDEPEEGEEKPEQRLADAVRDAKLALLKVSCCAVRHKSHPEHDAQGLHKLPRTFTNWARFDRTLCSSKGIA